MGKLGNRLGMGIRLIFIMEIRLISIIVVLRDEIIVFF